MRRIAAGLFGLALLAGAALAQAPERSLRPLPRPATVAAPSPVLPPQAQPGQVAGLGIDQTGALLRPPPPAPRPAFDSVQLPESMIPSRPETPAARAEPVARAVQPAPGQLRPAPRPPSLPGAPPSTAFSGDRMGVELPQPAQTRAAVAAAGAASISPYAPAASLRPLRRSPAALARHTEAVRRAERAPTTVAAGGTGTGRVTGGLCGVSTLEGRPLPRIPSQVQGCGVAEPVSVTAVAGIRLSQPATLDCDTARAFDRWVRQVMQPTMGRTGGGVTQIRVAAHYTCRPRNNRPGARVSEHGRGRAIDISGFRLANGQSVTVLTDWRRGPYRDALRQMHRNACGIFRTTLGPGSDGHHEDHFHYDMAQHRSGGTFCR